MQRDIRQSAVFLEAERIFDSVYRPGQNVINDIADIQLSSRPARLLCTGALAHDLESPPFTRIGEYDLDSHAMRVLTQGPNCDRHARIAPDGKTIAFLSDRDRCADFQLFLLDLGTHAVTAGPKVAGWVEYCEWSPDGGSILLGVAGHGADLSSGQGATTTDAIDDAMPAWMPRISAQPTDAMRRSAWVFDITTGGLSCASGSENIWEASWCGNDRLAVVTSHDPGEGAWYAAWLSTIDLSTGVMTSRFSPASQIGLPRSSPAGHCVAFVEALCSDRGYVAGDLRLCDLRDGSVRVLQTDNVDVTCIAWRSDNHLLLAGHRGLETVVLLIDVGRGLIRELWKSCAVTTAETYATVLGLETGEDFAFVCETFFDRPRIATLRGGMFQAAPIAGNDPDMRDACGDAGPVAWQAPDGLAIEGWLLRPHGPHPHAMIVWVHGGPVIHWRPFWLGRSAMAILLLRRGYAIFLPNPRGSSGRGQPFVAHVLGDVGGADTADFLSGIDHLVQAEIADPTRLGVMGLSYGGFMTCWLTTQDDRFAAAVSVGPATNHVSHHLLGNIPQFDSLFLQDHYTNLSGTYYSRSPLLQAHRSTTPTLLVCGDLDRCTPPEEALQFHAALLENGVEAVVARYPQEGHGVHGMPAAIDYAARCVMWFDDHIPSHKRNRAADIQVPPSAPKPTQ